MIDEKYFTAIPTAGYSDFLYKKHKENLNKSLFYLLSRVDKVFKYETDLICQKLNGLCNSAKISPAIFFLYFELLNSIRSNDIITTKIHLDNLINISPHSAFKICNINEEFWEQKVINDCESQVRFIAEKEIPKIKFNPIINESVFEEAKEKINNALTLILRNDKPLFDEISTYATCVKLHNGEVIVGLTSPKFFGAIFLSTPNSQSKNDCLYYVEHLIHEISHLNLNILLSFDKLITNDINDKFPAPIRKDLRPMLGVFHATYVLSRMLRVFIKIKKTEQQNDNFENLDFYIRNIQDKFDKGVGTVKKHAKTTPYGTLIIESLLETTLC